MVQFNLLELHPLLKVLSFTICLFHRDQVYLLWNLKNKNQGLGM
jgi:hypothetical protein